MFTNDLADIMYVVMISVGVFMALIIFCFYFKKLAKPTNFIFDLVLVGIVAILVGIVSSNLFQNLWDFIKNPKDYQYTGKMTFYGGLIGGVITFIIGYFFSFKKLYGPAMQEILIIAPGAITLAHGLGRIGCFFAGCCYGIDTEEWYGVYFPCLERKVIPTQLFEAIFLLILSAILLYLAFKKKFKYCMIVYLSSYSVFRFLIEYIRNDERGFKLFNIFSPSQSICLLIFIIIIPLFIIFKKVIYKENEK